MDGEPEVRRDQLGNAPERYAAGREGRLDFVVLAVEPHDPTVTVPVDVNDPMPDVDLPMVNWYNYYAPAGMWVHGQTPDGLSVSVLVHGWKPWLRCVPVDGKAIPASEAQARIERAVSFKGDSLPYRVTEETLARGMGVIFKEDGSEERYRCFRVEAKAMCPFNKIAKALRFNSGTVGLSTIESAASIDLRFQNDCGISCGTWVSVTRPEWTPCSARMTRSNLEAKVSSMEFIQPASEEVSATVPRFLVASYDIETYTPDWRTGRFPQSDKVADRVASIALALQWSTSDAPHLLVHFVVVTRPEVVDALAATADAHPPSGATKRVVRPFLREVDMLNDFYRTLEDILPTITVHYNGWGYDDAYLYDRLRMLTGGGRRGKLPAVASVHDNRDEYQRRGITGKLPTPAVMKRCARLVRAVDDRSRPQEGSFLVKAILKNDSTRWLQRHATPWSIDLFMYAQKNLQLDSYSLDSVSKSVLGMEKVDLPYREMFAALDERRADMSGIKPPGEHAADIWRVLTYGERDAELPARLLMVTGEHLKCLSLASTTGLSPAYYAHGGTQVPTYAGLLRFARARGAILNQVPGEAFGYHRDTKLHGAFVFSPNHTLRGRAVSTEDFASLYPNIIRAFNLCPSTLVMNPERMPPGTPHTRITDQNGFEYVFLYARQSILSEALTAFLSRRKEAKTRMGKIDPVADPLAYMVVNKEQASLKVFCNAAYGFFGTRTAAVYPCLPVAACTTAMGRRLILDTKDYVHRDWKPRGDFAGHSFRVYGGDTDSVFIMTDVEPPEDATDDRALHAYMSGMARAGKALEQELNQHYLRKYHQMRPGGDPDKSYIKIELEHTDFPFIQPKRKRYLYRTHFPSLDPNATWLRPSKVESKGIALVRRDQCAFVRGVAMAALSALLNSDRGAVREVLARAMLTLRAEEVPLADATYTCKYSRETYATSSKIATVLANLAGSTIARPFLGDRVPFVVAKTELDGPRVDKVTKRARHVLQATQADVDHAYLAQSLKAGIESFLRLAGGYDDLVDALAKTQAHLESSYARLYAGCATRDIATFFDRSSARRRPPDLTVRRTPKRRRASQKSLAAAWGRKSK